MSVSPPSLPADRLREEGWVRIESDERVLASLPVVTVRGHTIVYGDDRLREAVADATDPPLDQPWRFFFATQLALSPSPPASIGPSMFEGIVRSRAREGFATRLRERGYDTVERDRTEEIRIRTGERATLTRYRATDTVEMGTQSISLPIEGWVGVWHHDGTFRIAGGAYPATDLGTVLGIGVETDPNAFRSELFGLVREVA